MPRGEDTSRHPGRSVQRPTPRLANALAQNEYRVHRGNWGMESPRPAWTPSQATQSSAQGYINLYRTMRDQGDGSDYVKQMGAKIGSAIRQRGR